MKKFLPILLILSIVLCSFFTVNAAEEVPNIVDALNSSFEDVTAINETGWYKLIDAKGSSNKSASIFSNIEIKTDGGHTGNNYLSTTITQSWFSPAINIYPYIEDAGPDAYVISFWYKSNKDVKLSRYLIRGLASDAYEDGGEYQPDISSRGSGNYYAELSGSSTDPDTNGWRCFVSNPIEVASEQFDGQHNWWLCFDQLKATDSDPLILDIDDFVICSELDFETPEIVTEKDIVTEVTYINDEVKTNAIVTDDAEPVATPTATTPEEQKNDTDKKADLTMPIIIGSCVLVLSAAITAVIVIKKKKQ